MEENKINASPLDIMRNTPTLVQPSNTHSPGWNNKIEKTVKDIGEDCKSYKIMHLSTAHMFNNKYNIYMKLGIILGPASGVMSGSTFAFKEYHIWISLVAALIGFLSGVIVAILRFGNYEEFSSAHKIAAARYTSLESNVRRQLALYREDRISAMEYLDWISNSFDELFSAAPLVPTKQYEKFLVLAKKHGMKIPEEYQDTIYITNNYEDDKIFELSDSSDIKINLQESQYIKIPKRLQTIENKTRLKKVHEKNTSNVKQEVEEEKIEEEKIEEEKIEEEKIEEEKIEEEKIVIDIKDDKKRRDSFGKKNIKRTPTLCHYPDLAKYSDGMMNYEIKRMMNFSS